MFAKVICLLYYKYLLMLADVMQIHIFICLEQGFYSKVTNTACIKLSSNILIEIIKIKITIYFVFLLIKSIDFVDL